MSLGNDALALVKDVKKFEAQLAKLAKAEKSASSAIDRANVKADEIISEARAVERRSKTLMADAVGRIKQAESVEEDHRNLVRAAQEETQRAVAHEGRIGKAKAKLEQDRETHKAEVDEFNLEHGEFRDRVLAFDAAVESACNNAIG